MVISVIIVVAFQNLSCVIAPVTLGVITGWAGIIWSTEVMIPGLLSNLFLINPPGCLHLVIHGLLWNFLNRQAVQGENFLALLIFWGVINLLDNLSIYFKVQCFSL